MVSINDFSSKRTFAQPSQSNERRQADLKSPGCHPNRAKDNKVSRILAKAAVAAQIVTGMGNREKAAFQPGRHPGIADGSDDLPKDPGDDEMVAILKEIVANDSRWEPFAMGALGLHPDTESYSTVRDCLIKGFKEGAWEDGMANLIFSAAASEKRCNPVPDNPSTGLIAQRTQLWLKYPKYFETLFSAVREKSLPRKMGLYTSELLIKYLSTIG